MDLLNNVGVDRVSQLSAHGCFDYLIVGSGLGGGILANELSSKGQKVLLLERGGFPFSTHCLNTSRPHWQTGGTLGPSQDNDIVYAAHKEPISTTPESDPYVGGPVYGLGGRSTVWGLYSPKIDDESLAAYFPERIVRYLRSGGYERAFSLFTNGSQQADDVYPSAKDFDQEERNAVVRDPRFSITSFMSCLIITLFIIFFSI